MTIDALVEQLWAPDPNTRFAARDALIPYGAEAVEPVLRRLRDDTRTGEWGAATAVLIALGDAAFGPLVEVLAAEPGEEVRRRASWAFGFLELPDPSRYVPLLAHPSATVRECAVGALQSMGSAAVPFAESLVPLLADPDATVRERAAAAFVRMGAGAIPVLRAARRTPGPQRRPAFTALVEIGGWDAVEQADRWALERLVRGKLTHEVPEPMHLCGFWYAVPSTRQADVLDAFGLVDPWPVTMRLGASAWNHHQHAVPGGVEEMRCARHYVTPALDGWTLVFGDPREDPHADTGLSTAEAVHARCVALSARFGAAHWYGASCADEWTAWCLAEDGTVVRWYEIEEPDEQIGPPHPAESGYLLPHEDGFPEDAFDDIDVRHDRAGFDARFDQLKRDLAIPDPADAALIAARTSVDPSALGPATAVVGLGVLASRTCCRHRPGPRGVLAI
ncbi:MAG: HEAT repeat domain-containing protein [Actinocatenispora sp.]